MYYLNHESLQLRHFKIDIGINIKNQYVSRKLYLNNMTFINVKVNILMGKF